jgi:hypothetical protein
MRIGSSCSLLFFLRSETMIKDELSNLFKLQEIEDRCELLKQTLKSHPDLKRLCKLKKT